MSEQLVENRTLADMARRIRAAEESEARALERARRAEARVAELEQQISRIPNA